MATLRESGEIKNIAEVDDPLGLLADFYRGNGYDYDTSDLSSETREDGEIPPPLVLSRGKRGNSWWSSNMTELHTRVVIQKQDETIQIAYAVEVTGQILKDVERAFWKLERQAAEQYLRDPSKPIKDLRIQETARADEKSNSFLSFGLWGAVAIFMFIIFLGFVGVI